MQFLGGRQIKNRFFGVFFANMRQMMLQGNFSCISLNINMLDILLPPEKLFYFFQLQNWIKKMHQPD
jgi:hypothetical protein